MGAKVVSDTLGIGKTSPQDAAATAARGASQAAGAAAMAQEAEMKKMVEMAQGGVDRTNEAAAGIIAAAESPETLSAFRSSMAAQERNLNRQAELFASLDPAVMEAGKQALQLLQGEEARSLGPLREQRQRDRQKLVSRLREQMGPGAETSTAGIQALNQFDQQTSFMLSERQQQSLGQLFGMAGQGAAGRSALGQSAAVLSGLGAQSAASRVGARSTAAGLQQGALGQLLGAQQGRAQAAGGRFVGDQLRFQSDLATARQNMAFQQQMIGTAIGAGLGAMTGGGAGGGGGMNFNFGGMFTKDPQE